jgi:hypothetical protein
MTDANIPNERGIARHRASLFVFISCLLDRIRTGERDVPRAYAGIAEPEVQPRDVPDTRWNA